MNDMRLCMQKPSIFGQQQRCIQKSERDENADQFSLLNPISSSGAFTGSMQSLALCLIVMLIPVFANFDVDGFDCSQFWGRLCLRSSQDASGIVESIKRDLKMKGFALVVTRPDALLDPKFRRLLEEEKIAIGGSETSLQEIKKFRQRLKTSGGSPNSKGSNGSESAQDTVLITNPSDE